MARAAPCFYRPNTGKIQATPVAGDRGITRLKARKHWLEPCARRNAPEANRPAARRPGARDARRMSASSHFANSGDTCASQEHFRGAEKKLVSRFRSSQPNSPQSVCELRVRGLVDEIHLRAFLHHPGE